jgi:hypothetical protein
VTVTVQHDPRLDLILERVVDVAPSWYGRRGPSPSTSRNGSRRRRGKRSIAKSTFAPAASSAR